LTPLCFPNVNLESKRTSIPPVMLGPMLLHWDDNIVVRLVTVVVP
jgi:hypothetical protein